MNKLQAIYAQKIYFFFYYRIVVYVYCKQGGVVIIRI